jgi:LEA14-like dessication related protein
MKLASVVVTLLVATALVFPSCTPPPPALVGCKPEISNIGVTTGTPDWALITTNLSIKNPNAFPVTISGLTFKLDTGNGVQGYGEIPNNVEIAAGKEIMQTVSCNVTFMNIVSDLAMNSALSGAKAVGAAAPVWKGIGAQKPNLVPQASWDGMTAQNIVYAYEASVYTDALGQQKWIKNAGNWTAKK